MEKECKRIQDELLCKLKAEECKSIAYLKGYGDAISEMMILIDRHFKNKNRESC